MTLDAGSFVVSLDFELYWGMRDVVSLDDYRGHLEGVHEAVPRMLELFERYGVHATWATVGLVFARDQEEARSFAPQLRPSYLDPRLSPYEALDTPGLDADRRCYFAPDLARRIQQTPHQELGTHTFSHFYCGEPGQSLAEFEADLDAAVAIAEPFGARLQSLVFPRNQVNEGYLGALSRRGISSYRGVPRRWALQRGEGRWDVLARRGVRLADNYLRLTGPRTERPPGGHGVTNLSGTRFLRPYTARLRRWEPRREARILAEMADAAESRHAYHLWWHPHNFGRDPEDNLAMLARILEHARRLGHSHGFRSRTMTELAEHVSR